MHALIFRDRYFHLQGRGQGAFMYMCIICILWALNDKYSICYYSKVVTLLTAKKTYGEKKETGHNFYLKNCHNTEPTSLFHITEPTLKEVDEVVKAARTNSGKRSQWSVICCLQLLRSWWEINSLVSLPGVLPEEHLHRHLYAERRSRAYRRCHPTDAGGTWRQRRPGSPLSRLFQRLHVYSSQAGENLAQTTPCYDSIHTHRWVNVSTRFSSPDHLVIDDTLKGLMSRLLKFFLISPSGWE